MDSGGRMRLFVGIPLATTVVAELSAVVARLRSASDGLRWTQPESWHITLQFLGYTDQEHLQCLIACLGEVRSAPVRVRLEELGFFDRTGVFFVGVASTPDLLSLTERVITATTRCGFVAETRPFHPHITLARAKAGTHSLRALRAKVQRQPAFTPFLAAESLLYESHLLQAGANYRIRGRFPLTATR